MSEPRKHHLIPAFYLAGFTESGNQGGVLHAFRYATAKRYVTTPRKACRETDFYRVEEPGFDPNYVEKLMSWHEGVVAPHVQQVATGSVRDKRDVGETLALAALLAVRSRRGRTQIEAALAVGLGLRLRRGDVTPEQWEQLRESELRNGVAEEELPSFARARDRLLHGEWLPRAPAVLVAGLIPEMQDRFMQMLLHRHWELHVTDPLDNGGFITSDSPLVWGDLQEMVGGRQQGLDQHDLEITFPVSRSAALVSYPEARDATCDATDDLVAHVNMRTLQLSTGFVFHAHDEFLLRRSAGDVRPASEYFNYVADARRRGIINP
jgi:hypothetical protein